jgi:hypothetical protein
MPHVVERCADNKRKGYRPYLVVPEATMERAQAYALAANVSGSVAIVSIEQFVGQNLDEMGSFIPDKTTLELAALLREYNRRVAEVETDPSIQIVIPKNVDT